MGEATVTADDLRTFERTTLTDAVSLVPGVTATFDANGRRNESDVLVRGFGRWQVPLLIDGVRIYLPADNRLDFTRFLTADVAAIQIQKGYASVLDGPGAMGGAINLVTAVPQRRLEARGSLSAGLDGADAWNGDVTVGTRGRRYFAQGSLARSDRDSWTLSRNYSPTESSLQEPGVRVGSDTRDWRANIKAGFTPNATDEYTINHTTQSGAKGAPLNVYNNPPVPPNSYWRWPWWDVRSTSVLTSTQLGPSTYVKSRTYYNTFDNALDAFDDGSYSSQSANGRFRSLYDDEAYGVSVEVGTAPTERQALKAAAHYRRDVHAEQNLNRPTHPTLATVDPLQTQSQYTWSVALEHSLAASANVDLVGGVSYDRYAITRAEEFNATQGLYEYPKGGADAVNWQAAAIWRPNVSSDSAWRFSVSDRARFPIIFELYSTRFGTATPNPSLGPERATNLEVGWTGHAGPQTRLSAAVFYSRIRNAIQTVVLPDTTTQTQNVGTGNFSGIEAAIDTRLAPALRVGGNYSFIHRELTDTLRPDLRATGVPAHRAWLHARWQMTEQAQMTSSLELAGERWSDVNTSPAQEFPYVRTGRFAMLNVEATYTITRGVEVGIGARNLLDDHIELAWGYPEPGRSIHLRTRFAF